MDFCAEYGSIDCASRSMDIADPQIAPNIGITGDNAPIVRWINAFLSDRLQRIGLIVDARHCVGTRKWPPAAAAGFGRISCFSAERNARPCVYLFRRCVNSPMMKSSHSWWRTTYIPLNPCYRIIYFRQPRAKILEVYGKRCFWPPDWHQRYQPNYFKTI